MNTNKFRTRQEFVRTATNPKAKKQVVGLDVGYSAVKCFHEGGYFCFPSYVRRLDEDLIVTGDDDILYQSMDTGETYLIGRAAQDMAGSMETNDTDGELFSRKRYGSRSFKILCNTAVALALPEKEDSREIVIQTGLPSSYEEADTPAIKKAICRPSRFRIKSRETGGTWREYSLAPEERNVFVMAQPAGTLYNALIQPDGKYTPNARQMLFSNILILDIGFGTFDFYGIKNRTVACRESIDEIGMKQVMKETSKRIMDKFGEEVRVTALQKVLQSGIVNCLNEDTMKSEEHPVAPLLDEANEKVFREAIERAKSVTSAFRDYNYIIVTGGTGEAWLDKIKDYLSGLTTVKVMAGNSNDKLPMLYSNARGYYMFRYNSCKK